MSEAVSTVLCEIEKIASRQDEEDVSVDETISLDYDAAVGAALVACEAASPQDRFRLIETANGNFLLVTNVLPREKSACSVEGDADGNASRSSNVFDALTTLDRERRAPGLGHGQEYALRNVALGGYDGRLLSGSYIVYTRRQLRSALSLDKRDIVESVLRYVDTPGILDHNNVADVEALLWLLFCGPRSLCENDRCFGCDQEGVGVPFPVLLPPVFYEPVRDYLTYVNLAELYVYVWYRDYDLPLADGEDASGGDLGSVALERLEKVLTSVRQRFSERNVPVWPVCSRTCLFCALYNQNRVCIDFAKNNVRVTSYSPILIRDCRDATTNVTLSHVLPGNQSVSLFPIYDIGALLKSLCGVSGEENESG